MSDPDLADLLFTDPDRALAGYDVTAEESALFRDTADAEFKAQDGLPEERRSFGVDLLNRNQTALKIR